MLTLHSLKGAIWWPVFAFVLLGLDHVVANMFYIPLAIFYHHPQIVSIPRMHYSLIY
jgi:formate/nitrite transporter FocA (FNT family)